MINRLKNKQVLFLFIVVLTGILSILVSNLKVFAQVPIDFTYIYDGNQRLVRAIDSDGNVLTYTYDPVGNLLSITRATAASLVPVTTGITPVSLNQGETQEIVISGTGLLGSTLGTGNPGITIEDIIITDTEVTATLTTDADAPLGPATLNLTTPLGTTSITFLVKGPLPRLISLSPASGTSFGGTPVTLFGTNLTLDTTVSIGGLPASDVVFVDASTITARTPAGMPGTLADIILSNVNGSSTFAGGFRYGGPFRIPGALAIETGGTGTLTVRLAEPAVTALPMTLSNANPAVATLPASAIIPAGGVSVEIPVTAVGEGTSLVTVTLGEVSLSTTVFVSPPFAGNIDLVSAPVGAFVVPIEGITLAPVVGVEVAPTRLPTLVMTRSETRTVALTLVQPAPVGGLCVGIMINNMALATLPVEVCILAGEQTVSFDVTALASGEAIITVEAGDEVLGVSLLVDKIPDITGAGLAPPVGAFVVPIEGITLAPVVGVFVSPTEGITFAPVVGAEVAPTRLPTLAMTRSETRTVTLTLAQPAPVGGLCVAIMINNPAQATIPAEVCIPEGEQTVSFDVTALASGEAIITVTAGEEIISLSLLVDKILDITGAGLAPPVGAFVTPIEGITLSPVVGVEVR